MALCIRISASAGLAQAIRAVAAGQRYLGPEITQALIERSQREPDSFAPPVSPAHARSRCWPWMAGQLGHLPRNRAQLFISEETVRTHVKRIRPSSASPTAPRRSSPPCAWGCLNWATATEGSQQSIITRTAQRGS